MFTLALLERLRRDNRGAVAILAAVSGALLIVCSAGAVDVGLVYLENRSLQGAADLAAMAAARDPATADAAAVATVSDNKIHAPVATKVTPGRYEANSAKAYDQRFTAGASNPNAVRVDLVSSADLIFGQVIFGKTTVPIHSSAIAARAELASFSIGTRLASLDGGIANAILTGLTGSSVSLSVMDYNALAGADIDILAYCNALRTKLSLKGASFDKVLATSMSTGDALAAASQVLSAAGDLQAATALNKIAVASKGLGPANLDALIDLGPIGAQDQVVSVNATRVDVSALDLANAMLLTANQNRQVELNLGASIPGVADLDVFLGVGERANQSPWLALDDVGGATVRTNQARLYLRARTLGALGGLGLKSINLPVLVELASGEAKLADISCPGALSSGRVSVDVRPSVGSLAIADIDPDKIDDFKHALATAPATIVDLGPLLKVTGTAQAKLGGQAWQRVEFTRADIDAGAIKTVQTNDIAKASLSSLIDDTDLTVKALGIPLTIDASVLGALKTLGAPLDTVVNSFTGLLGVRLGQADIRVHGLRCRDAVLVG